VGTWLAFAMLFLMVSCAPDSGSETHSKGGTTHGNHAPGDVSTNLSTEQKSDWVRFGFDPSRSGVNPGETLVTPKTVGGLRKLWRVELPGIADSSPVLLHGLEFPEGQRDALYATTKNGGIIALDAASGKTLWSNETSGPQITTSSPVADPSKGLIYSYGLDGMLHKYDATTGKESKGDGWPVRVTRMPETEKGSSALNISGGRVYATTSGYVGDAPPYQGHVVAIDETTGASKVFNSLCSDVDHLLSEDGCSSQRSGIWARGGAVIDPATGGVFATTGNGPYDANTGGDDYGDSVFRLDPNDLRISDSYTPETYQELEKADADLGSTAPALLPKIPDSKTPFLLIQGGKDKKLRLIDRQDLSGEGGPGHLGGELQEIDSPVCGTFTQPVVWTDERDQVKVIVAGTCGLAGYRVFTNAEGATHLRLAWKTSDKSTTPVLAGGVLFSATDGALLALNPRNGRHLWSSAQDNVGGTIDDIHWESPIAVNGRIYVSDQSGAMSAYGLPGK